ncbi:putative serine/threonine-protein kinase pats1 [Stylophora pistillata]|uniref:Putative serine/threonine-protein kinase pats1 n=1 Tax=Stylophora pistillata TaxID=50429 RepID=A0A2B4R3E7_STYPI|nr:putative serine/threonine-protein kinase pats1 [Stylophora pistillata]
MEREFIPVPIDLKAHIIGRHRSVINEMMTRSGAIIEPGRREHAGFIVSGRPEELEVARQLISEKLEELNNNWDELVEIPNSYKGRVIGKYRATLRQIETQTEVKLIVKDGEVYIVRGTHQQRRHAKMNIGTIVAGARLKYFENEFYKVRAYVDGCHLPANCKLKLQEVQMEDRMALPGSETQYRLELAEHCESKNLHHDRNDTVYQSDLKDEVLMSLRKIKDNRETDESPKADMWCHLGTSIIRVREEDDIGQKTWDIEEIAENFQRPDSGEKMFWKVSFRERDDIPEDIFKRTGLKEITEDNEYISRYDLTYLTPCFNQLRYRTAIRGDVPEIEVRRALSTYLSRLTLTDEDAFGLRLPDHDFPDGFHLLHKRCCQRKMYSTRPGFFAILSQEDSWWIDPLGNERSRKSTDLHLHSEECDKLLNGTDWEPEVIAQKLPEFIQFVKEIQGFVVREMNGYGSTRTVPPEIRARGPEALEAYKDALAEGQTCVKRVPLMFVGQDRSGKTSVKKSLKGISFNPDEDSTVGIEVDTYDCKVTTEVWKTGKKDLRENFDEASFSFEHNTARWIADKLMEEENVANVRGRGSTLSENYDDFEETNTLEERYPSETASYTEPSGSPTNRANVHPSLGEPSLTTRGEYNLTPTKYDDDVLNSTSGEVPEGIAKLISQFLQDDWKDDRGDIYSITWDFAGQSVYYVTHPLFLTRRAIYFLVYDLSRNPSDKAIPLVKQGVYRKIEDKYNLKTNFDYLEFWMSSLASLMEQKNRPQSSEKEVLPKKLPAVFLVCTHADKPYCNRNPFALAKEIFGDLKAKPNGAHLFDVFCVDNTVSGSEFECQEIMRLREKVHEVATELPHVNEAIPIKWLKYENALRVIKENDRKFISLATAKEIAFKVCKINKNNEIVTLLNFLHDLRVLIHFDDSPELSDLVILDTQWLIDVFKSVITVRSYDSEEKNFADLWLKLEKEGILEEKLLKHVWNSLIPQKETHETLIAIMEKFSLLCPWPSSQDSCNKHYLVPSMLRTNPPKMISSLVESAQIPSLFLKFDAGQVPPGLFPRFVLEFFLWCRIEFPRSVPPQIYNNFARFYIFPDQGLSIVLLCHSSAIEVIVVSVNSEIGMVDMASIRVFRSQLTLMIDRIWNKFFWVKNVACRVCFLCPICSHGRMVSFCTQHFIENCEQEDCLHFISESDFDNKTPQVLCKKFATAQDNRIQAEDFAPWISLSEDKVVTGQRDERPILKDRAEEKSTELRHEAVTSLQLSTLVSTEVERILVPSLAGSWQMQPLLSDQFQLGTKKLQDAVNTSKWREESTLELPSGIREFLQLKSEHSETVVAKLLQHLKLDDSSFKDPLAEHKTEAKKWIRCLMREAKCLNRTDVAEYLRKTMPAGTTGPLLEECCNVLEIPIRLKTDLAVRLCGGDEWKIVAEKLGFQDSHIRCLDNRFKNPFAVILENCSMMCVGQLYNVLVDCGFPLIADLL